MDGDFVKFKMKTFLFPIIFMFVVIRPVNALCDNELEERLRKEANAVEISYNLIQNTTEEEFTKYKNPIHDEVEIVIKNVTEGISISGEDDWDDGEDDSLYPKERISVTFADTTNGEYRYRISAGPIRRFTINIKSNSDCGEKVEVVRNFVVPGFNFYSLLDECKNSRAFYCKSYIDEEITLTREEVLERVRQENKGSNLSEEEIDVSESVRTLFLYIGGGILAIGVAAGVIYLIRRKRSRLS